MAVCAFAWAQRYGKGFTAREGQAVKTQIVYTLCKDMVYTMLGIANANIDSEGGRSPTELSIFAARLAAPQTRIAIN